MTWSDPQYLWLLLFIPVLGIALWGWNRYNQQKRSRYFSERIYQTLVKPLWISGYRFKLGAQGTALSLLIIALAGPQIGTEIREIDRKGVNLMVALDLSRSMLAEDVGPNRLEKGKFELYHLLSQLSGDRIGLITFTSQAIVQTPLTQDYSTMRMFLDMAEPELMPTHGTDLRAPLAVAAESFREVGERESDAANVLLLVSDGEDHGPGFSSELEELVDLGVYIYTVGIGTESGAYIPVTEEESDAAIDVFRDRRGNVVTTSLETESLQRMADATGGSYVEISRTSHSMDEFINKINRHEHASFITDEFADYTNRYQIAAGMALVLLVLSFIIPTYKSED